MRQWHSYTQRLGRKAQLLENLDLYPIVIERVIGGIITRHRCRDEEATPLHRSISGPRLRVLAGFLPLNHGKDDQASDHFESISEG